MQTSKLDYKKLLSSITITLILVSVFATTLVITPVLGSGEWWNADWPYRKSITINHNMVDANFTNFPVLIDLTDPDLASKAQDDGDDIAFTDYSGNKLNHEIELFNETDGRLVAWVNVSSLSSIADTALYMYYGNVTAPNQENVTGVWDPNFQGVWHVDQTSGGTNAWKDSTSNGYDGTDYNMTQADLGTDFDVAGKINGAVRFDGINDTMSTTLYPGDGSRTLEFWVNFDIVSGQNQLVGCHDGSNHRFYAGINSDNKIFFGVGDKTCSRTVDSEMSAGNWYYIVVTADGSTAKCYINTVEKESLSYSQSGSDTDGFHIGSKTFVGAADSFVDGIIDEVRVSSTARSAAWLSTSYKNQNNPSGFYSVGSEETFGAPIVSDPSPPDGATGVSISLSQLSFDLTDDDLMDYSVVTSPDIGSGSASGVSNGRYTVSISGLEYNTTYTWYVNVADGTHWTNKTYSFTTERGLGRWWDTDWPFRKEVTIDHMKVAADLADFSVLIDVTDSDLADKAQDDGDDIVFTDCYGTQLNHEVELFNGATGRLVAWVNVASLYSTTDTILYMYYGNAGASNQENPSGVWDSHYVMVQHLEETYGIHYDSTSNNNDGTSHGSMNQDATGKINGADDFDGSNDYISCGTTNMPTTSATVSTWVRPSAGFAVGDQDEYIVEIYHTGSDRAIFYLNDDGRARMLVASDGVTRLAYSDSTSWSEQWYYLVGTWDSTSTRLYIDGSEDSTPADGWHISTPTVVAIGSRSTAAANCFNGTIDEFRISDTARSASWISTEYNNQHSPSTFYSIGSEETSGAPIVSDPSPSNGAVGVSVSLPELSFNLMDYQGDLMDYSVVTSPDIGSDSASGISNGTYTVSVSGLEYNTTYTWYVSVTDGTHWTNKTYSFTTQFEPGGWWDTDWQHRKKIIIDHMKVAADLADFSVLIDVTDSDLADKAQDDGDDIVFTDCYGTQLNHEVELFNGATGRLVAWVNVASLYSTTDTILYMYYGNAGASNQENVAGVWNSNFQGVWHLDQTSGGANAWKDNTSNGYDGTDYDMDASDPGTDFDAAGKINGAVRFDGINDTMSTTLYPGDGSRTLEYWVNYDTTSGNPDSTYGVGCQAIGCHDGSDHRFYAGIRNDSLIFFGVGNARKQTTYSGISAGNWYYIVVTADGSTARYYINGIQRDSFSYSQSGSSADSFHMGSKTMGGAADSFVDGVIDEVRISDTARSVGWISTSFNNQFNPSGFYGVGSEQSYTEAPSLSDENPRDGSTDVSLNPTLSIHAFDYQGDNMTIIFKTNATGTWQDIGMYTNVGNGVYNVTTTNMNSFSTRYWWGVNATDPTGSGNWTTRIFSFTTRPENYAPDVSDPSPSDGATGVPISLWQLSFNLIDLDGDPMDYIVTTSPDIGSRSETDVHDGTITIPVSGLSYNTTYTWHVNVTDGTAWTNETYSFTTKEELEFTLKWTSSVGCRGWRVADINGDGVKDVIAPHVRALDGATGTMIWSYSPSMGCGGEIEVADLNNDGIPEVLVTLANGVNDTGLLVLHGNNGSLYWMRTGLGGYTMPCSPIVFDLDRDGYPTVFTISRRTDGVLDGSKICAFSYDGDLLYYSNRVYYPCWGGLSIMDYDNDGHFELYFGDNGDTELGYGDCIKSFWAENLTVRWVVRPRTTPPILDASANFIQLIDVTEDGIRDLVIITRGSDASWHGGRTGVAVLSAKDGSLLRLSDRYLSSCLSTAIYDIDHDGNPEVIGCGAIGDSNNYFTVFDLVNWVKEVEIPLTSGTRYQPTVADVTGDGYMDIIVPDVGVGLRIFNRTYDQIGLIALLGSGDISTPQVMDLDGDGLNEILVSCGGLFQVYETDGASPPGGVRSGMKHFSEYRLGASEYVTFIALKDEFPQRDSTNQSLNPTLSIDVYNYQGESMTVTFSTNVTGTWQVIGTHSGGNGIYSQPTTNMNSPNMTYWWSVNVTDGYTWNKVTYKFTTTETPPQTTVQVYPATTDADLDSDYIIYINVTNAVDLYAWEFQLDYNQAILNVTSVSVVPGGLNTPTYTYHNLTDQANGHLWWAVSTVHPTTTGISYAQHAIFEIHFHTIGAGTSNLGLYGTFLSDSNINPISHTVVNGSITVAGVAEIDLIVTSIDVLDHGCTIYKNDTYVNGTAYYYAVEVTVYNNGTQTAGPFYVKLEVYWINGSQVEDSAEILVAGLAGKTSVAVNFTSLFHPMHTGYYRLTATVDSQNDVIESDETNNTLVQSDIPVTVIGDINCDGKVDILDAVIIALAWGATPSDPQWNICADINHDGHINILDGVRIGLHWGETW